MARLDLALARAIAAHVAARTGANDFAFLRQRETVYYARGVDAVRTAPVVLIQGVCAAWPRDAHYILRNPIQASREPGPFALGMVQVAARRIRVVEPSGGELAESFEMREVTCGDGPLGSLRSLEANGGPLEANGTRSHAEWLRFAESLVGPPRDDLPRHARDRRVGAALVSPSGELLGASANTNGADRTRHAELNVLLARWLDTGERLAPGTRLYATLRPCKMCAGLVWELSAVPGTVLVYFAEDDPGSAARNTVLCPGSPMRARFARTPAELTAPGCIGMA